MSKPPAEKPDDVTDEVWQEWLTMRRKQKSSTSLLVLRKTREAAEAAGMTMDAALTHWVAQGYKGFFPPEKGKWQKPAEPQRNVLPDNLRPAIVQHDAGNADCLCDNCCAKRRRSTSLFLEDLARAKA